MKHEVLEERWLQYMFGQVCVGGSFVLRNCVVHHGDWKERELEGNQGTRAAPFRSLREIQASYIRHLPHFRTSSASSGAPGTAKWTWITEALIRPM